MLNYLKGEVFAAMAASAGSVDGEGAFARLHEHRTVRASGSTMFDEAGKRLVEIGQVAPEDPTYLGASAARYPDVSITTIDEVAAPFTGRDMGVSGGILRALPRTTSSLPNALASRLAFCVALTSIRCPGRTVYG